MSRFRQKFELFNKKLIQWYPGHMAKGTRQMQLKLKSVDCIIEVHDSRIPFSGRNTELHYSLLTAKPSILVLNKKDLIPPELRNKIYDKIRSENDQPQNHTFFTNCKDPKCDGIKKIIPKAIELIKDSNRYHRQEEKERSIMIIGVPNVGKSSITNVLRNRHLKKRAASHVGAEAGITRSVLTKIKVCEDPLIFLLDTPGVMMPNIREIETGMKLALCACFQDHIVGDEIIADYLLYYLNKTKNFSYVEFLGLTEPTDDITKCLLSNSQKLNLTRRLKSMVNNSVEERPDLYMSAKYFVRAFRDGQFGKLCLDIDKID
jgi:mitochondrial GTPase 1